MKQINIIVILLAAGALFLSACEPFLEREPSASESVEALFVDEINAIQATNAIYDAFSWDEANFGASHTYPWIYGDVLSDDATKAGGGATDLAGITELEEWRANPANAPSRSEWINKFAAIYRANLVITNLDVEETAFGNKTLQDRLVGEAKFMRALSYFHLTRLFGSLPLVAEPAQTDQWGRIERSSPGDVLAFVYEDLRDAIAKLPLKSAYGPEDVGRATRGAARAILARAYCFEVSLFGENGPNNIAWQMVLDQTQALIESGQYSLEPNYARIFEDEAENGVESIFELQFAFNAASYSDDPPGHAESAGTANTIIQGSRDHYGWGFNSPTEDLYNVYEEGDPRREVSIVVDGDGVYGEQIAISNAYGGPRLNRKYQVTLDYSDGVNSGQNILIERYGDVLLMHAEAAANIGGAQQIADAVEKINMIRQRARNSTYPRGYHIGSNTYDPRDASGVASLQDLAVGISQENLIQIVREERRKELAMEGYRYYDILRWGVLEQAYLDKFATISGVDGQQVANRAKEIAAQNEYAVLPIPQGEASGWGLGQNGGYSSNE